MTMSKLLVGGDLKTILKLTLVCSTFGTHPGRAGHECKEFPQQQGHNSLFWTQRIVGAALLHTTSYLYCLQLEQNRENSLQIDS